ncbi:MAG: ATP synthase subunit I [Burkholderiales bacterium]|nr:ATP synthase subunit I [Burkholderiales bacterium]
MLQSIASVFEDDSDDRDFVPLTREQAARLRAANPTLSPWWVVAGQLVAGVLVALLAWGWTGRQNAGLSAAYGALAVVIPAALFARCLTGRLASANAAAAFVGLFVWEAVKVAVTIGMLIAAPRLVKGLSWPALLLGLAAGLSVYWVALLVRPKRKTG